MIDVKIKDRELQDQIDAVRHGDILAALFNGPLGPYLKPGQKYPFTSKGFIPKRLLPKKQREILTQEEKARLWSEAGNAFVNRCKNG